MSAMEKKPAKEPVPAKKAGALGRRSDDELLADIRRGIANGYIEGSVERIKRIAASKTDPNLLRELVNILAELVEDPPTRKRGRPKKAWLDAAIAAATKGKQIDLDSVPVLTEKELRHQLARNLQDWRVFEEVALLSGRLTLTGAIREVARTQNMSESEARKAYYRAKSSV